MGIRVLLVAVGAFLLPLTMHAQFAGVEPLEISITPEYPRPYQTVSVRPSSTLIDLAAASVTVSANGTVVGQGSGSAPVNVALGGPGSLTTIRVSATVEGKTYTRELRVRPAEVSLIVEPQTSRHPFYAGGTGVASEGQLRLVAISDLRSSAGTRLDPATLVYTWRLGDRILEAQSGIGKYYMSASAPVRYRDTVVSVTVTTQDSAIVSRAEVLVAPIDPLVRIYRNDPLLGPLFDTALSGTVTMDDEETFRAVPYHFAGGSGITWLVNGAENGSDRDITLRATGTGGGSASLIARVKQAATFALAEARLGVKFGEERALGIFGL
ncbi:MAG TPA: hypothetical protein VEA36_01245 [Candidatus Paceibacterota bacterium]|nr:hypothetical protein [Candidatus Paceibacterota bacterium]